MRVALGQINTTIGDFAGNLEKIRGTVERARGAGADLVLLPELAICGYPPMDLLERPSFLQDQTRALEALVPESRGIAIVCGAIVPAPQGRAKGIASAAVAMVDGEIAHVQAKSVSQSARTSGAGSSGASDDRTRPTRSRSLRRRAPR
jgi:predicted amidohydrolase